MDMWTKTMLLKKIGRRGRAVVTFHTLPQMFGSMSEIRELCRKEGLKYRFGRECLIFTRKKDENTEK